MESAAPLTAEERLARSRAMQSKVYCEFCKKDTYVKPNGNCPGCGRLTTLFPGFHTDPETLQ